MKFGFEIINILAVIGTTFLMLAVYTVWSMHLFFGRYMSQKQVEEAPGLRAVVRVGAIALCLFVAIAILAYVLAVAPLAGVEPLLAACGLLLLVLALLAVYASASNQSFREYLINSLFCTVCVIGGAVLLLYWPA